MENPTSRLEIRSWNSGEPGSRLHIQLRALIYYLLAGSWVGGVCWQWIDQSPNCWYKSFKLLHTLYLCCCEDPWSWVNLVIIFESGSGGKQLKNVSFFQGKRGEALHENGSYSADKQGITLTFYLRTQHLTRLIHTKLTNNSTMGMICISQEWFIG